MQRVDISPTVHVTAEGSKALQVALFTGLTHPERGPLFDVSEEQLAEIIENPDYMKLDDALNVGINAAGLGITLGGSATAAFRGLDFTNFDGLMTFGLGLLLYSPTRDHPASAPQVIIWYPLRAGDDKSFETFNALRKEMQAILTEAMLAALPEDIQVHEQAFNAYRVSGPEECVDPGDGRKCYAIVLPRDPVRSADLEGNETWMWRNWQYGDKEDQRTGTVYGPSIQLEREGYKPKALPVSSDHDFLQRFSANLPAWAWVYAPQSETKPPMMFNAGKAHLFLEPGAQELLASP